MKKQKMVQLVCFFWSVLTIATGQFGDPSNADVLVTVPAEDFVRIYSGEANLSNVTSLILRGKISVYDKCLIILLE